MNARRSSLVAIAVALSSCHPPATDGERASHASPLERVTRLVAGDAVLSAMIAPRTESFERDGEWLTSIGWRDASAKRFDGLGARLAARADVPFEVGASRIARLRLSIVREGARAAAAELDGGRVVYRDAFAGVDVIAATTRERYEELYLLRDESAPATFTWRIALPASVSSVRVEPSGGAAFVDARGEVVLAMPRPFAIDAAGTRRDATLAWTHGQLTISLDRSGLQHPIVLDPALETYAWSLRTPTKSPGARALSAMAYDAARKRTVLYGGQGPNGTGGTQYFFDTWEWDGTTWADRATTGPRLSGWPAQGVAMAYDSARGVAVMLGQNETAGAMETWEWNGTAWSQRSATSPPRRTGHALAYDATRARTVLFGGTSSTGSLGDTWEWDGTTWANKTPSTGVSARYWHSMTYDDRRKVVVLFGGAGVTDLDTWEWNGTAWTRLSLTPGARFGHVMAFDTARGRSIVFGGRDSALTQYSNTVERIGTTWTTTTTSGPPFLERASMAFHAATGDTILFGGYQQAVGQYFGGTWTYRSRGGACTADSECDTAHCVDGVCCETASCGTCQACNLTNPGVCTSLVDAADPDSCTGTSSCDKNGACLKVKGQACTAGSQCVSTYCVDGVCCDGACGALCHACSAALKASGKDDGVCDVARSGVDPRSQCAPTSTSTCKQDGFCNGAGACRLYVAGTACGAGTCTTDNKATGSLCDGSGTCQAGASVDCTPGLCKSGGCVSTCTTDSDCAVTGFCNSGSCAARRANGQACTKGAECTSNLCADGVCCNSPCLGQCEACDVAGGEGSCVPVAGAPHGKRAACAAGSAEAPCAAATCDGATRDRCAAFAGSELACRPQSCASGVQTLSAACDGKGNCPAAVTKRCDPYGCTADACKTSCAADADCASGYHCETTNGQCVRASTCDGDHTTTSSDGAKKDCTPFKCESSGACRSSCASSAECVAGHVCDPASGKCIAPNASSEDGGGCAFSAVGRGDTALVVVALAAVGLLRKRRPRARVR